MYLVNSKENAELKEDYMYFKFWILTRCDEFLCNDYTYNGCFDDIDNMDDNYR